MGYRELPRPKHKPRRTMQKTTTHLHVYVDNGETSSLAIPCWYKEVFKPREVFHHCRDWHDHVGWPEPRHPDHSCQRWDFAHSCCTWDGDNRCRGHVCHHYVDLGKVIPIHLTKEGYSEIKVVPDIKYKGLTCTGSIDKDEDWVIRLFFDANCPDATDKTIETMFSVFAIRGKNRDIVTRGKLHIALGPLTS